MEYIWLSGFMKYKWISGFMEYIWISKHREYMDIRIHGIYMDIGFMEYIWISGYMKYIWISEYREYMDIRIHEIYMDIRTWGIYGYQDAWNIHGYIYNDPKFTKVPEEGIYWYPVGFLHFNSSLLSGFMITVYCKVQSVPRNMTVERGLKGRLWSLK